MFARGRLGEAMLAFERLARDYPERLDIRAKRGHLALLADDAAAAIEDLSGVMQRGLRTREILSHLAEAYYRAGNLRTAAYCYQQLGREGLAGTLAVMADLSLYRLEHVGAGVELPWLTAEPLPVIRARVNGWDANLVLDTGAGDTVLDTQFAIQAEVRLGGGEYREFAGGQRAPVTHGHARELGLADLVLGDIPVQVLDIQSAFGGWFPDLPVHGILGVGVLSRFRASLDYRNARLRLTPPGVENDKAARPADGTEGSPLWMAANRLLLTQADLPALEQALVFLDSGMTGTEFAASAGRMAELGHEADGREALDGTGGGGSVQGRKVSLEWLRLDRLQRYELDAAILESFPLERSQGFLIHGLVGHDMLRDSLLTLDFPNMRMRLE